MTAAYPAPSLYKRALASRSMKISTTRLPKILGYFGFDGIVTIVVVRASCLGEEMHQKRAWWWRCGVADESRFHDRARRDG